MLPIDVNVIKAVSNRRENSPNRGKGHRHKSVAISPAFERTSFFKTVWGMNPGLI